jgi:ABC-type amino acid transport substrate-binding protein
MKQTLCKFFSILAFVSMSFTSTAEDFQFYAINSSPAGFKDGTGVKGYYVDILKRVSEELGVTSPKISLGPYPRLLKALNENSKGYVLTCLFPSPKFGDKVSQPSKVAHFTTGIITMKGSPLSWDAMKGKRIATVKGASKVYGQKFHEYVENKTIKLVSVTDYSQAMKMLKANRIDGFAGNLGPILNQVKAVGLDIAEPLVITEKVSMITVSVAPGTENGDAMVAKIGKIVESMLASGEIQDIIESYLPEAKQPR